MSVRTVRDIKPLKLKHRKEKGMRIGVGRCPLGSQAAGGPEHAGRAPNADAPWRDTHQRWIR